jgi:phosphoribosylanthranilate isomerase
MSLFVKICGLTSAEAVAACAEAGVDAVGFVFSKSPRRVRPETAALLAESVAPATLKVAVFCRPEPGEVELALQVFPADVVQADHDTLHDVSAPAVLPVYRESRVGASDDIHARRFLYEGAVSGVGMSVDRERASRMARQGEMILAGGLDPGNVASVVETVRPFGVDVSSGVESQPGIKDPGRIHEFVASARAAAERLVRA